MTTYGYDITCDPGDLYNRKCYVNVHDPPGCDASDPACTITQQEVIGYTDGGDPISKAPSQSSWMAWIPSLTSLNDSGVAFQPYGQTGIPYTPHGIAGVSGSGADYPSESSNDASTSPQEPPAEASPLQSSVIALGIASAIMMGAKWISTRSLNITKIAEGVN